MSNKVQGTVKWFSNKKGFGFITPSEGSPTTEDIFVHQSCILSTGYRTVDEGWEVEFTIGQDEGSRLKAENVTGVGGGPCTGPSSRPYRNRKTVMEGDAENFDQEDQEGNQNRARRQPRGRGGAKKDASQFWHNGLNPEVKEAITAKNIRIATGTIDISLGKTRIKLGTGGYSSVANADGIIGEGTFDCLADGQGTITLEKVIAFTDGEWKPKPVEECDLPLKFSLADDEVGNVEPDETALTLWGDTPSDPRAELEANGFLMRRVVLTHKNGR